MADEDNAHWRQMEAHRRRQERDFIPFWCRPSEGRCEYEDQGERIKVTLEVVTLGTVTIYVEPRYSYRTGRLWNQDAVLTATIT